MADAPPPLRDVPYAARYLHVPRSWIYARIESPDCDLTHYRIGRYIRFTDADLDAYIAARRHGGREVTRVTGQQGGA